MAFIFGGNTGLSYEEMLRQRDLATQLAGNVSQGGYTALGSGLASGLLARRAEKAQKAGAEAAQGKAQSVLGQLFGQQVMGGQPMRPGGAAPLDPMSPTAIAGDTMAALGKDGGTAGYRASLIGTESGGNWGAQNNEVGAGGQAGHYGRVQFGKARLQEAMNAGAIPQGTTPEQFMASPALQVAAENWHFGDLENQLGDLVGTVVNGKPLDMGALVAMGHLGGAGGARRYVESGGKYNPSDSFGTSLAEYADTHGGQTTMSAQNAPTAGGMDPAALVSAMSDPYLDEGTRSVLGQLFQAQIQKSDPSYQMGMQADQLALEKAQLELDQARNPKPGYRTLSKQEAQQIGLPDGGVYQVGPDWQIEILQQSPGGNTPAAFASLDLQARAAGFEPGTPEYQDFMRNGGGSGTPAAFTALDMQAKAAGLEPGTPEYQTFMATRGAGMAAEAKAKGEASAAAEIAAPADVATADRTLTYIDEVRKHPGLSMGTGVSSVFNSVPGTSGRDFDNRVKQLTSGAFLTAIDEMRGMGALSNTEGQTATAAITRMDTSTSEEEFLAALRDYEDIVKLGRGRASGRMKGPTAQKEAGTGTTLTYNPQTEDFE